MSLFTKASRHTIKDMEAYVDGCCSLQEVSAIEQKIRIDPELKNIIEKLHNQRQSIRVWWCEKSKH